jgi:hypothetical protein
VPGIPNYADTVAVRSVAEYKLDTLPGTSLFTDMSAFADAVSGCLMTLFYLKTCYSIGRDGKAIMNGCFRIFKEKVSCS